MPSTEQNTRFDRLLAAMTGSSAEKPASIRGPSSRDDSGDCDETRTYPATSEIPRPDVNARPIDAAL